MLNLSEEFCNEYQARCIIWNNELCKPEWKRRAYAIINFEEFEKGACMALNIDRYTLKIAVQKWFTEKYGYCPAYLR